MSRCGAYLVFLMAVLAASGEQTSGFSTKAVSRHQREPLAESEDSGAGGDEETTKNNGRHHSWAQATAEKAVSAAILDWRLIAV